MNNNNNAYIFNRLRFSFFFLKNKKRMKRDVWTSDSLFLIPFVCLSLCLASSQSNHLNPFLLISPCSGSPLSFQWLPGKVALRILQGNIILTLRTPTSNGDLNSRPPAVERVLTSLNSFTMQSNGHYRTR